MSFGDIQTGSLAVAFVAAFIGFYFYASWEGSTSIPLPPGPPPKILSGNAHQVPKSEYWKTYKQWSKKYGPIIFFRIFGRKIVVLNTFKSATDLLESRSGQYSDRPRLWMYGELVGRKLAVFNISSQNPRFRIYRKLLHSGLNARAIEGYHGLIQEEAEKLLERLVQTPEDFIAHLRQNAGAIILRLAYGWNVNELNDRFVVLMEQAFFNASHATQPGRWLVDVFPILRFVPAWFPGAGFRRTAEEYKKQMHLTEETPFAWVKEQIESGTYIPSFTSHHLLPDDGQVPNAEEEDILKWCSGALYAGGADTTVAFMTAFFAAMALHPKVQQRAQAEIDQVIENGQTPTSSDLEKLTYVTTVIKEVLRWAPPVPLGLPHRVLEEDNYLGYQIPKGATVMANIWAMANDKNVYPNPSSFNPDRFLRTKENNEKPQLDPREFVFGFGRRVCPGAQFAEISTSLTVVNILSALNISKAVDSTGQPIPLNVEFTTALTRYPFVFFVSSFDLS
ncbi:hypothetical protein AX17_002927 [Amanita inopinata Kibby_2008]|nr:hypothetical protein AX17_002927 [Amanita inopinata Kibby_2008]